MVIYGLNLTPLISYRIFDNHEEHLYFLFCKFILYPNEIRIFFHLIHDNEVVVVKNRQKATFKVVLRLPFDNRVRLVFEYQLIQARSR